MREFSSLDLQQQSGEIQRSAAGSPVLILNHGKPRSVMMSVEEFRRLKLAADETLPSEVAKPRAIVRRGVLKDPLGYDTADLRQVAADMAQAAESGRNRDAVRAEIAAVERRLGNLVTAPNDDIARRSRILIPDTTPLSLLALVGSDALDWLFVPGADVWISDMVKEEAIRDPDPGDDQRLQHRAVLRQWFARNANRINIKPTREGEEYAKAMQNWQLAGSKADLKPSWKGRGERSVLQVLEVVESVLADGEAAVVLVDDNKARIAIQLENQFDIDLMGTESFVTWMRDRFKMPNAEHAWAAIRIAAGGSVPDTRDDDPVFVRK